MRILVSVLRYNTGQTPEFKFYQPSYEVLGDMDDAFTPSEDGLQQLRAAVGASMPITTTKFEHIQQTKQFLAMEGKPLEEYLKNMWVEI